MVNNRIMALRMKRYPDPNPVMPNIISVRVRHPSIKLGCWFMNALINDFMIVMF